MEKKRKSPRLVADFIIPALDSEKYGAALKWKDRNRGIFSLMWNHKSSVSWTIMNNAVFSDWDKLKGRFNPREDDYYVKSKQRFRSALRQAAIVQEMKSSNKGFKVYEILRSNAIGKRKKLRKRKKLKDSIPTIGTSNNSLNDMKNDNFTEELVDSELLTFTESTTLSDNVEENETESLSKEIIDFAIEEYYLALKKRLSQLRKVPE